MLEIHIRYAEKKDVKSLKKFDPVYKYFGKRMVDQVPIIIAEIGGNMAGYLIYVCAEHCYYFEHVFVAPEYRGMCVATVLMRLLTQKILGHDDGFKRLYIETSVKEADMAKSLEKVKFLRKMGFTVLSFEDNEYTLRYERPEISVMRITASDRQSSLFPETFPECLGEGLD